MGTTTSEIQCPNLHRHTYTIRAIEFETAAECERLKAKRSEIFFIEKPRSAKSALARLEDDLNTIRLNGRRKIKKAEDEFYLKWFLWRSALPISLVTNIRPRDILVGGRQPEVVVARRLCIWLTWESGKFSYYRIGLALGCDHSTIRHSMTIVKDALTKPSSAFSLLLDDVLRLEGSRELEGPPENSQRRTNRRRKSRA